VHSETRQLLVEPEVLEVSASLLRDLLQNVWDDDRDALERTLGRMVCALKDSICLVIGRDITGTMEMFSGSTPRDRASIIRLLSTLYALWPLITTEAPTRTLYPKRIFCMLIGLATRVVETFDGTSVGGSARMPHEDSVVIFEKLLSAVAKLSSGSEVPNVRVSRKCLLTAAALRPLWRATLASGSARHRDVLWRWLASTRLFGAQSTVTLLKLPMEVLTLSRRQASSCTTPRFAQSLQI
jgi:hypothetical protein